MSEKETGGPAFGQVVQLRAVRVEMDGSTDWEPEAMLHGGLTVRDYFAAKAMNGYLASFHPHSEPVEYATRIAEDSYTLADAMLKARNA